MFCHLASLLGPLPLLWVLLKKNGRRKARGKQMIISRRSQSFYFYYSMQIKGRNHLMLHKKIRQPAMQFCQWLWRNITQGRHIQYSDITADGNYDFVNETLVVTDTIWCNYIHFSKKHLRPRKTWIFVIWTARVLRLKPTIIQHKPSGYRLNLKTPSYR